MGFDSALDKLTEISCHPPVKIMISKLARSQAPVLVSGESSWVKSSQLT